MPRVASAVFASRLEERLQVGFHPVGEVSYLNGRLHAHRRKRVFHMRRDDVEGAPLHHTVLFEQLKRLRQHPLADPADPTTQLAEPHGSREQRDERQYAPPAGEMVEDLAGGACGRQNIAA